MMSLLYFSIITMVMCVPLGHSGDNYIRYLVKDGHSQGYRLAQCSYVHKAVIITKPVVNLQASCFQPERQWRIGIVGTYSMLC